jgi:hypothetical protein
MVSSAQHFSRPRIGIEHGDAAFRRALSAALDSYECRHLTGGHDRASLVGLDVAIVQRTTCAERILSGSPRVSLLRWGRPAEAPVGWTWDGWINPSLEAPRAADVLLELIDSGLLARNHGPEPHPRKTSTK